VLSNADRRAAVYACLEYLENLGAGRLAIGDLFYLYDLKKAKTESRFGLEESEINWLLGIAQRQGWNIAEWQVRREAEDRERQAAKPEPSHAGGQQK
jgi:hypothetical protein